MTFLPSLLCSPAASRVLLRLYASESLVLLVMPLPNLDQNPEILAPTLPIAAKEEVRSSVKTKNGTVLMINAIKPVQKLVVLLLLAESMMREAISLPPMTKPAMGNNNRRPWNILSQRSKSFLVFGNI